MPYNPGITYDTRSIGQGILALAEGFAAAQEKKQDELDRAKASDQFVKLNPDLLSEAGLAPEDYSLLAPRDRTALVAGTMQAMGYRKAVADLRGLADLARERQATSDNLSEMAKYHAQMTQNLAAADQQDQSLGDALRNAGLRQAGSTYIPIMPALPTVPLPGATPESAVLLSNVGGAAKERGLRALAEVARAQGRNREPVSKQIAGRDVVYSPDTGAFQVLPPVQGGNMDLVPQYDPDTGDLLGHSYYNGKTWQFVKAPAGAGGATPEPLPGMPGWFNVGGKLAHVSLADRLMGTNAPTATPPAKAGPKGATVDTAVAVSSRAEYDALPKGAWFINPSDGRRYQKTQ